MIDINKIINIQLRRQIQVIGIVIDLLQNGIWSIVNRLELVMVLALEMLLVHTQPDSVANLKLHWHCMMILEGLITSLGGL